VHLLDMGDLCGPTSIGHVFVLSMPINRISLCIFRHEPCHQLSFEHSFLLFGGSLSGRNLWIKLYALIRCEGSDRWLRNYPAKLLMTGFSVFPGVSGFLGTLLIRRRGFSLLLILEALSRM